MFPKYILITKEAWQRKRDRYVEVDLMENLK